jgi:hypothetical protein
VKHLLSILFVAVAVPGLAQNLEIDPFDNDEPPALLEAGGDAIGNWLDSPAEPEPVVVVDPDPDRWRDEVTSRLGDGASFTSDQALKIAMEVAKADEVAEDYYAALGIVYYASVANENASEELLDEAAEYLKGLLDMAPYIPREVDEDADGFSFDDGFDGAFEPGGLDDPTDEQISDTFSDDMAMADELGLLDEDAPEPLIIESSWSTPQQSQATLNSLAVHMRHMPIMTRKTHFHKRTIYAHGTGGEVVETPLGKQLVYLSAMDTDVWWKDLTTIPEELEPGTDPQPPGNDSTLPGPQPNQ